MNTFAGIDIVFAVLILLLILRCSLRGIVEEALSVAAVVLGLLAAFLLYKNGAEFLRGKFFGETRLLPEILAFIAIFLVVFVLIQVLKSILKDIIEGISLGGVDRFLGGIFGLLEGFVLVSLLLLALTLQPLFNAAALLRGSFFAELLLPLIGMPETWSLPVLRAHPWGGG